MSFLNTTAEQAQQRVMPVLSRRALALAVVLSAALLACWYAAFHSVTLARADAHAYFEFLGLSQHNATLARLALRVADLCQPTPYVYLAAIPVIVALIRRRWALAVGLLVMIPCAIESAELLKSVTAVPRPAYGVANTPLSSQGSFASGHSTAAMVLAMACVLASPARWRPLVALVGTIFSLAVIYAVLTLGWHYPSDALAGILVAAIWTLVTAAAVLHVDAHYGRNLAGIGSARGSARVHLPSTVALALAAAVPVCVVLVARGHQAVSYATDHRSVVVALALVAVFAVVAQGILGLALRGSRRLPR